MNEFIMNLLNFYKAKGTCAFQCGFIYTYPLICFSGIFLFFSSYELMVLEVYFHSMLHEKIHFN